MDSADTSNFLRAEAELVLAQARKEKSERTKTFGSPIQLSGKPLAIVIRDGTAWVAENTTFVRKVDLQTGKTLQLYKGHTAPVTSIAFCDKVYGSGDGKILITGSWDQTIKLWDTETKLLLSSTATHADFVKSLLVLPSLGLLVSGSSDKVVRFWDISTANEAKPLSSAGSISSHTRPVECLYGRAESSSSATLYTADTMGVIKVWDLEKENGQSPRWRSTLKGELNHHRTGINEILYGKGQLWTASSDETVQITHHPPVPPDAGIRIIPPIAHPSPVRALLPLSLTPLGEPYLLTGAGDMIRIYDVSSLDEPELLGEVDAHWHDVTILKLWVRKWEGEDGRVRVEPWIVSGSLDGTIRKWRLSELLNPTEVVPAVDKMVATPMPPQRTCDKFEITEDEERELAELSDSDGGRFSH